MYSYSNRKQAEYLKDHEDDAILFYVHKSDITYLRNPLNSESEIGWSNTAWDLMRSGEIPSLVMTCPCMGELGDVKYSDFRMWDMSKNSLIC